MASPVNYDSLHFHFQINIPIEWILLSIKKQ